LIALLCRRADVAVGDPPHHDADERHDSAEHGDVHRRGNASSQSAGFFARIDVFVLFPRVQQETQNRAWEQPNRDERKQRSRQRCDSSEESNSRGKVSRYPPFKHRRADREDQQRDTWSDENAESHHPTHRNPRGSA
jgi:hypothetical protein